jgi:hypothetical protein
VGQAPHAIENVLVKVLDAKVAKVPAAKKKGRKLNHKWFFILSSGLHGLM